MHPVARQASAVLMPLVACGLQWMLWDLIRPHALFLFFPAVLLAAVIAGRGGGITATAISVVLAWFVFMPPQFPSGPADASHANYIVLIAGFAVTGILFSLFGERIRNTTRPLVPRASDVKLRKVLDNAADAVLIADPQGRFTYANAQAAALLGYPAEELLCSGVRDIAATDMDILAHAGAQPTGEPRQVRMETSLRRQDGALVPVDLNTTVLPDGSLYCSCRDISEIVAARQALSRSERLYRRMFETSTDAVAITRLNDGICVEVNQSFIDILEYARDEVIGRAIVDLGIWVDAADRERLIEALKQHGKCRNLQARFRKKHGEMGWGHLSAALLDIDGVPCIISMTRDITEQKRAEDELLRHRTQLEQLVQERTASLTTIDAKLHDTLFALEKIGVAIHWVHADTGRFLHVNGFAAETLGYSVEEMLNMSVPDIDPNYDATTMIRELKNMRDRKHACLETVNRTKDGRLIPVEVIVYYLPPRADEPARCIAFVTDISARKTTEQALLAAKKAAETANAAKSAFLANMSHEIRTPLHVIIGLGNLLRRNQEDPVQRERLDHLCASSDHLLEIINDVLDFSKIEAAELVIDQSTFHLDDVVARVVRMVQGQAQEKGLTLTAALAPALRAIGLTGDPLRLAQVLINLCGNAVKFTCQGAVRLDIDCLAADAAGLTLRFAVQDTRIGMSAAEQARLFKPFSQVDGSSTRRYEGTGLGLAISQRLVTLMGGLIVVDSAPGTGSTFSFELVLPRAAKPVPAAAEGVAPVVANLHGRHVLFAEDHLMSQEILLEMLEDQGCTVDVAADGAEAVACARTRGYDLVLLDMHMPIMDGITAARTIRALPGYRETPIVALTASAFAEDRLRCAAAGMNDHIAKPVTPETLAAALARWLPADAPAGAIGE